MFVELQGIHSYSPSMAGKSVQHCSLLHSGLPLHMGITPLCLGLHNDDFGYGLFVWNESWHSSDRDFCRRWYFHGSSVQQGLSRQVHRKVASQSGDRRHSVWKSLKKSHINMIVEMRHFRLFWTTVQHNKKVWEGDLGLKDHQYCCQITLW